MKLSSLTALTITLLLTACGVAVSPDDGGADAADDGADAADCGLGAPSNGSPACGCDPAVLAHTWAGMDGTPCTGLTGTTCVGGSSDLSGLRSCTCGPDERWHCAGPLAADGGGACNTLPLGAQVVATHVAAPLPTPEGGQLADGTYELTAITDYEADSPDAGAPQFTMAATMELAGDRMQIANTGIGWISGPTNQTWQFVAQGARITRVHLCGAGAVFDVDHFTITPTGVDLYGTIGRGTGGTVWTFTRQ